MGVAAVGKVGRHEARVCGVVGAVAGADIEGELDLAALVEALRMPEAAGRDFAVAAEEGRQFPTEAEWAELFKKAAA